MKKRTTRAFRKFFVGVLFLSLANTGCTPSEKPSGSDGKETASSTRKLNLAIWGSYLDPEEEARFEKATGIDVEVTNYSSNEELLAKIQTGSGGIDLAVPSDYMVGILIKQGLLLPLQPDQIKHRGQIDPQFMGQAYDPQNTYSLPYAWTTTGIAIQKELYSGPLSGWKALMETAALKGKVSLLDDSREVFGMALKTLGFSVNSRNEAEIKAAQDWLIQRKPQIKLFRSDVVDTLLRKEVAAAQAYGTEALQAWRKSGGKVSFVLPEEGGVYSIDNFVIPKGAQHVDEAHALIDYFLTPEVNVRFVEKILAGPVLKGVRELLPADLKNNPALFPSADHLKKFEKIEDLGPATRLYDRAWTELKSF